MPVLDVDFNPRPGRKRLLTAGLLLAAIPLLVHQCWAWKQAQAQSEAVATQIAELHTRLAEQEKARRPLTEVAPPAYGTDASEVAVGADFDTAGVFAALESARGPGIRVNSLELVASNRQCVVELDLQDLSALPQYIEDLNAGETQQHWRLLRMASQGAGPAGVATVLGKWPPPSQRTVESR